MFFIGPLVFFAKFFKAVNLLNKAYNRREDRRDGYIDRQYKKERIIASDYADDERPRKRRPDPKYVTDDIFKDDGKPVRRKRPVSDPVEDISDYEELEEID